MCIYQRVLNSFNIVAVPVHTCEILPQMQLEAPHSEPAGLFKKNKNKTIYI